MADWHPLVDSYYAQCLIGLQALQTLQIQRPGDPLLPCANVTPEQVLLSPEQAARIKAYWEKYYNGDCGLVLLLDDDEPPDPDDGERLKWAA